MSVAHPRAPARSAASKAENSKPLQWLVRAGFLARAITYGLIGVLTLGLALGLGTDGAAPNQQGALSLIARTGFGKVALVVIATGLLAYALWKLAQAILGHGPEGGGSPAPFDRVSNLGGGIVYIGFFVVALRALTGSAGNSSKQPKHTAAGVLGWPGGPVLVGIAGVALIAISLYQAYDGISGNFADESKTGEMQPDERRTFMTLGRIGLVARALVFVLVGWFVLKAAIDFNPRKAVGVDGALARLAHQPLGPWLVGLAGVGLLVFAVYSLFEARYRRL